MISDKAKFAVAKLLEGMMKKAEIVVNDKVQTITILRTEVDKDVLKVYTQASKGEGTVTNIIIRDAEGDIILERPKSVVKNNNFGLISTFWIKIGETEVQNPISIFELGGDRT